MTTNQPTADCKLTIDTNHLRETWLPVWREHLASLNYMDKASLRAIGKTTYQPLHTARMAVKFQMDELSLVILDNGGLLLIGGAA